MAIATTNVAMNMNNWQFYGDGPDGIAVTPSLITEDLAGGRETLYTGAGFFANDNGIYGTVNTVRHYLGEDLQYQVTGLSHSAHTVSEYLGEDDSTVLSFLFNSNDTINGSAFADTLNGYNGNDTINGKGGADKINGGGGNDTIVWGAGDTVNGAAGTDTLKTTINLDLTVLNDSKILNVETINLAGNNTLKLNLQDLLAFPGDDLKVLGNGLDTVNFVGTEGAGVIEGAFTRYTFAGGASLLIDSDITVM